LHASEVLGLVFVAGDGDHHLLEDDAGNLHCQSKVLYLMRYHQNEQGLAFSPDGPCSLCSNFHVLDDQVQIQDGVAGMARLVPVAPSPVSVLQLRQKGQAQVWQLCAQKRDHYVPMEVVLPLSFALRAVDHVKLAPGKVH
jgi:hypothetical protein